MINLVPKPVDAKVSFDDALPKIPHNADLIKVIQLIKETRAFYSTNKLVSCEAIAMALYHRTDSLNRKRLFKQAQRYFRGDLSKEIAV